MSPSFGIIETKNQEVKDENSNKNPTVLSVQRDYMAGEVSKALTKKLLLPRDIVEAHDAGIIHFHDTDYFAQHMHNCFNRETRFETNRGIKAFSDFDNGEKVVVRDKEGNWREATVRMYGVQHMQKVTLRCGKNIKEVTCTPNHRWILADGEVTTNLQVGDVLWRTKRATTDDLPQTKRECEMFAFGFVIGDGCDAKPCYLRGRLCGDKVQYQDIFRKGGYSISPMTGDDNDLLFCKRRDFGKQDFLTNRMWKMLSAEDLKWLFKGYFAADGCYDRNVIHTSDERVLEMIEDISVCCGYHVLNTKTIIHDTNFKKGAVLYKVQFILHLDNRSWVVTDIEDIGIEDEAWCVEEPITNSFTLENGVVTGNCCLVNLEDMLNNGTVISGTMIEKPHSFSTACNIATQVMASVASMQYGGQTETFSHLAPFVDVSRQRIKAEVTEELADLKGILGEDAFEAKIKEITEKRVRDEVKRGVQTIQYQITTLMTTNRTNAFRESVHVPW